MTVTRANVEATKSFIRARLGNPYVYGGALSPSNVRQGTDCSEVCQTSLEMALGRYVPGRQGEGATTESYRYISIGGRGPFGTIRVASPSDVPADAAAKIALHHGPGGGANSHMWMELDGMRIESAGSKGLVTQPNARAFTDSYATAWAYLPGPIVADGTPVTVVEPPDTLYADVSEWQPPVTDAYTAAGYRVLCIRSNDGTHRDLDWANNYTWCKRATDDGRLAFFIVYFVWRPGQPSVDTLKSMVGQPHPKMAVMIDVESWNGQIRGNQSAGINAAFQQVATWLGDRRRVIGYGNKGDLDTLWPSKPAGVRLVVAGYGANPDYPGKIAHQYTDGQGFGGGLPEGAPPFGNCDMNSADGLTATAFAAALGIQTTTPGITDPMEEVMALSVPSLSIYATPNEPDVPVATMIAALDAHGPHEPYTENLARSGDVDAIRRVARTAAGLGKYGTATGPVEQASRVLNEINAANPQFILAATTK